MILLFKKIISSLVILCLIFSLEVFASEKSDFLINAPEEFLVYGEDNGEIAELLGVEENKLDSFFEEKNIAYFAATEDNKKQITLYSYKNEFSSGIDNLNGIKNDKIKELLPDILRTENIKAKVFVENGQKFAENKLESKDSGGEFCLIQYYTVANGNNYLLNFYTHSSENSKYVDKIFKNYSKSEFFKKSAEKNVDGMICIVAVIFIILVFSIFVLTVSVIVDIKRKRAKLKDKS